MLLPALDIQSRFAQYERDNQGTGRGARPNQERSRKPEAMPRFSKVGGRIVAVDSQSTDGSLAIAQEHGAHVVQFHFNGTWPKKKNWALENLPFRNEWVFILAPQRNEPTGKKLIATRL
jgi:hypothetical protein